MCKGKTGNAIVQCPSFNKQFSVVPSFDLVTLRGIICKDKVGVLGMVTDLENKLCDYSTRHYKQYPTFKNLIYELLPWQPMETEKPQNLRLVFCNFLDSFKSRY